MVKKLKPTTSSKRGSTRIEFRKHLTRAKPNKKLTMGRKAKNARSAGKISVRHRGGGHKKKLRDVDFNFKKVDVPAVVESIEYDPNRSGFIALICFKDGEKKYILASQSVSVGDEIISSTNAPLKAGNRTLLSQIPVGSFVYNIELQPGGKAKIARSAGNRAQVVAHDSGYTHLKMPSTEIKKVLGRCFANIGAVSNEEHRLVVSGKAGRSRWLGRRPIVRGVAMVPASHVHGGGEGHTGRAVKRPRTKWGKPSGSGQKTRKPKKYSNHTIISRRRVGKRRK